MLYHYASQREDGRVRARTARELLVFPAVLGGTTEGSIAFCGSSPVPDGVVGGDLISRLSFCFDLCGRPGSSPLSLVGLNWGFAAAHVHRNPTPPPNTLTDKDFLQPEILAGVTVLDIASGLTVKCNFVRLC